MQRRLTFENEADKRTPIELLGPVLSVRGLQVVTPERGVSRGEAIGALESSPDVLYAEPDRIRRASVVPNDDLFGLEWGMNNTGQSANGTTGTPDADIDATDAWAV